MLYINKLKIPDRTYYKHFLPITTRWHDNDIYGHVNNVVYYAYFDTVINTFLIRHGGLNIQKAATIGVCVSSSCQFKKSLSFPDEIEGGLTVSKIGNTSVKYEVGIFKKGSQDPAAFGDFIHVFVNRENQTPVPIPSELKSALQSIQEEQQPAKL